MIKQYNAIGMQCRQFCDVQQNLRHLSNCIDMAFTLVSQELPVKLVCLPESAIQGFPLGEPRLRPSLVRKRTSSPRKRKR